MGRKRNIAIGWRHAQTQRLQTQPRRPIELAAPYTREWCCLCGFPIPKSVFNFDPLAFSVDHAIPISARGQNIPSNRFPAHRNCNRMKGQLVHVPFHLVGQMEAEIIVLLKKIGREFSMREIRKFRSRRLSPVRKEYPSLRWEDDGGAVV